MAIHKLTTRRVENAKPGKYLDGNGLQLRVSPGGSKRWILRTTFRGKRVEYAIGNYPNIDLATARSTATKMKGGMALGKTPEEIRASLFRNETTQKDIPTFTSCAAKYIRLQRRSWKNPKHAKQWVRTLKTYARPKIGNKSVDQITTDDVLTVLSPIWFSKSETAKRVQGRIERVLDFAIAHEYRERNPARWIHHLDNLLPKIGKRQKAHHPAMPFEDVPAFVRDLRTCKFASAYALEFLILTATRTSEVINTEWSEINMKERVWTIPAARTKTGREHRVPLSDAAVSLLQSIPKIDGQLYVFCGARYSKPLSNAALLQLMRGMGFEKGSEKGHFVPHGFRSSFRDWASEVTSFSNQVAEMALAHAISDKTESAYRRGDLFIKRQKMMQEWADYLEKHIA